ncbi:hypothetical protein TNCV_2301611 [Trichonephila clavipes]|nr:hypothetical protein TNCV_2301611 [Trichonephila clavipes]
MANWHECPAFPKVKPKKGDAAQNRNSKKNQSTPKPNKEDSIYDSTWQSAYGYGIGTGIYATDTLKDVITSATQLAKMEAFRKCKQACVDTLRQMPDHYPDVPFYRRAPGAARHEETMAIAVSDIDSYDPCKAP